MSANNHCCIGFATSSNLILQRRCCSLVQQQNHTVTLSATELECITRAQLAHCFQTEDEDNQTFQLYNGDDVHLLRCRPIFLNNVSSDDDKNIQTMFGIREAAVSASVTDSIPVNVSFFEPVVDDEMNQESCSCVHPRGCWKRRSCNNLASEYLNQHTILSSVQFEGHVKIIDLTKLQDQRKNRKAGYHPSFDSPEKIFHLLRSTLNCTLDDQTYELHSVSPWKINYRKGLGVKSANFGNPHIASSRDQLVALLIKSPSELIKTSWDELERKEYRELVDFRVGDAAPSFYLYSTLQLSSRTEFFEALHQNANRESSADNNLFGSRVSLFVYRKLPPRDILSSPSGEGNYYEYPGCLIETFVDLPEDLDDGDSQLPIEPVLRQRMVSPPYLMHNDVFPGLLDPLVQRIDDIQREAKLIPQWTAWPERNHYPSSGENGESSWTVFPLCYTFPANDITQRRFIDKTCAFVPQTTTLLKGLGQSLRTALFSRLHPKTKLGTHTGWSDLANHVLRVHIPLIVPRGEVCGTWVDGCVETQDVGRIICFDDSKVHRAFNYSENEERIVLIIDLKRPDGLPQGTAIGGHTDELDAFIQELQQGSVPNTLK